MTKLNERFSFKYTFDIFNVTNTPSFDVPVDNVSQNLFFNDFPLYGQPLYSSPTASGLGVVNKTIGGPRQIQMIFLFQPGARKGSAAKRQLPLTAANAAPKLSAFLNKMQSATRAVRRLRDTAMVTDWFARPILNVKDVEASLRFC